jgi:hypothetical protein
MTRPPRPARAAALALAGALALAAPAPAQTTTDRGLPIFDSAEDMRAELDRLVRDRDFVAVVERFSPPATMSLGRVRVLQDRLKDTLAPLEDSTHFLREEISQEMTREVIAYWTGDTYVYVYLLTHDREGGLRVLDFQITGDVRQIGDWW